MLAFVSPNSGKIEIYDATSAVSPISDRVVYVYLLGTVEPYLGTLWREASTSIRNRIRQEWRDDDRKRRTRHRFADKDWDTAVIKHEII